jgi:hypothetical protein
VLLLTAPVEAEELLPAVTAPVTLNVPVAEFMAPGPPVPPVTLPVMFIVPELELLTP